MASSFEKVKTYLYELGYQIQSEDTEEEIVVINDESNGISNMILDCEEDILIIEQFIMKNQKDNTHFHKRLLQLNRDFVHGAFVLDDSAQGLLKATITYEGAFVLLPKTGDFLEIQTLVKNIFAPNPWADATNQRVKVAIQNGTKKPGLATNVAQSLETLGFNIVDISNASRQDYEESIIYDLSNGEIGGSTLKELKTKLNAQVSTGLSGVLILNEPGLADSAHLTPPKLPQPRPDVLIIVGEDY